MDEKEKPADDQVVVIPTIPKLPSGVYDTGEIARRVSEADLAENPPDEKEESDSKNEPPRVSRLPIA